ncbi:MAG: lipoprotein [Aquitalea sp.]|nr:lipoprotein [Aquitalea sp.]
MLRTLLTCLALSLVVTACGYKGSLYLPKPDHSHAQTSAPAAQSKPAQ